MRFRKCYSMGAAGGNLDGESSVSGAGSVKRVSISIQCSDGSKFTVLTGFESTVEEFKVVIAQKCDVPAKQQRLIYNGRILKDDQNLASYGLQEKHAVHMIRSFVSDSPTSVIGNANPGVGGLNHNNSPGDLGASPFPILGVNEFDGQGASDFDTELSRFEQMQNPNFLDGILSGTPAFESLMNDPYVIQCMMMSNPLTREFVDWNPKFSHVLNDHIGLQQRIMEMTRNPELIREIIHCDSFMSNYESTEGLNMLRPMHHNVQEPILNATPVARETGNHSAVNPFTALLRRRGRGHPFANLWTQSTANDGIQTNTTIGAYPTRAETGPATNDVLDSFRLSQFVGNPIQSFLSDLDVTNQQELPFERYSFSLLTEQQSTPGQCRTSGATGNPNSAAVNSLADLFNSVGSVSRTVSNTASVPREQVCNAQENIQALRATAGHIHAAVEILLQNIIWFTLLSPPHFSSEREIYLICFYKNQVRMY
ncbi:ubiquitin domain-containing protein DSK2a isoform X2 [Jatropha curcas]|uniref:ubiquitin domain-containing protein DSK2a isoform X2 n=1 Tax=Jatropha curcas TaxID=180498 RepID=UPI0009D6D8CC|nr:ubiquitin domain-containing protein DSK2a isoform X2 [Jatropha curcas]